MAKLTVTYEHTEEEDGYNSKTTIERFNVNNLEDMAFHFYEVVIASGFVAESVAVEKSDGKMVWSTW